MNVCFAHPETIKTVYYASAVKFHTGFFEDGSHSRTTVERRQNVNFNLAPLYMYMENNIVKEEHVACYILRVTSPVREQLQISGKKY